MTGQKKYMRLHTVITVSDVNILVTKFQQFYSPVFLKTGIFQISIFTSLERPRSELCAEYSFNYFPIIFVIRQLTIEQMVLLTIDVRNRPKAAKSSVQEFISFHRIIFIKNGFHRLKIERELLRLPDSNANSFRE